MLESQGRISLNAEVCEKLKIKSGTPVEFVKLDNFRFKIVPASKVKDDDEVIVASERSIDEKYRVIVPAEIRKNYTRHCLLTVNQKGEFFLSFFELAVERKTKEQK